MLVQVITQEILALLWRLGPVLGGPLCDILVLDVHSVDLYQDVQVNFAFSQKLASYCAKLGKYQPSGYGEQQTHLRSMVIVIDHGVWLLDFNNNKKIKKISNVVVNYVLLDFCVQFQPSRLCLCGFVHKIAVAKATMAMVGNFQPNPKNEIQGNDQQ